MKIEKNLTPSPSIDTHCHLDMIAKETGLSILKILQNAEQANIRSILQIAVDLNSSRENIQNIQEYDAILSNGAVYCAMGIHPLYVNHDSPNHLKEILQLVKTQALKNPLFWGIGETGLDYFHCQDVEIIELQKKCMHTHLQFASDHNLPVVLHLRETKIYDPTKTQVISDAWNIVRNYPKLRGVLHCYAYTNKEAAQFVNRGWFVSYSGLITYKGTKAIQEGLQKLPLECLLVETDAPYLTPRSHLPNKNQPAYVQETMNTLCHLRATEASSATENSDLQKSIRTQILKNAEQFFHLRKTFESKDTSSTQ